MEPPAAKKRKKGAIVCLGCNESASESIKWAAYDEDEQACGSACMQCWKAYVLGWADIVEWDAFPDLLESSTQESSEFANARELCKGDSIAPWKAHDIDDAEEIRLDIKRSMVGMSRADFVNLVGKGPEDDKIPLADLKDETNTSFKGV